MQNLPLKLDLNNLGVEEPEDGPLLEAISASIKSRTSLSFAENDQYKLFIFTKKNSTNATSWYHCLKSDLLAKCSSFLHRARALNFNYRQTHIDSYSECQMKIQIIGQKLPNSKVTDSKSSLKIPSIFFGESQIIAIFSITISFWHSLYFSPLTIRFQCVDTIQFFRQTSILTQIMETVEYYVCRKSSDVFSTYSSLFILCFLAIKSQWLSFHSFQLHHEHVYFWEQAGNSHFAQHLYHTDGKLDTYFFTFIWVFVRSNTNDFC